MASLKDIRTRINSVRTTRQVTSAMKMVSAAKFKKAQDNVEHIRPYAERLDHIINSLGIVDQESNYEWFRKDGKGKVLLVAFSSNRGLAGSFNANIIKETERLIESTYKDLLKANELDIIAVGKQVGKALYARHYPIVGHFNDLYQNVSWDTVEVLSEALLKHFLDGDYREIHFIYNQFINAATQEVKTVKFYHSR
jgi:F0F1-type ATP synthase, gamma subunit